jgi:hypothetical protein
MSETNSWMQLALPYFGEVTRVVFDDWFLTRDARVVRDVANGPIWYESSAGVIVEFAYYLEDAPAYAPTINLGVMDGSVFRGVGLWAVIPPNTTEADYYRWSFSDHAQLQRSFERIRDEIMTAYVEPLLSKPEAILDAAKRQKQ